VELCLGTGDEPAGSSWMRLKGQTNVGDIGVGVCYRLPDQEKVDEAFFRQVEEASGPLGEL